MMKILGKSILRRLSESDAIELIRRLIDANPDMNRTELANQLCDRLGFTTILGKKQLSGCLKALRKLEARGLFVLPNPEKKVGKPEPRRLEHSVPSPEGVPDTVDKINRLKLVLVETEEQMRIWNELHIREHPRGAGPFVGRQLRYLICSEHGWLGGLGFAASALRLKDREAWIGWDDDTRQRYLDRIVGLNRFLIRPSVKCKNLASISLSMAMKQMRKDFEARYGFTPWLVETFVDTETSSGTCFRAANWIRIGRTQGTGRYDSEQYGNETIKDIYICEVVDDFRERMGLPTHSGLGALPLDADLDAASWSEREFGGAPLGDERLSKRLVQSAAIQAQNPGRAFSGAAQGDRAMTKAYYRFIEQPDESAVTMENIMLPHRKQTIRRMQAQETVLCIQDGTDLNYHGLADCEGLGLIGKNQTQATTRGLHLHSTLAVTDQGLPLGILRAQCWAPTFRDENDERKSSQIPIEEKKDFCWIEGLRDCMAVAEDMPHTQLVCVLDREADFFELFDEWRQNPSVELLVRAKHNRRTMETLKLFDAVKATEPKLEFELHIKRQSARPKKSKQKARPGRAERIAHVTMRYCRVELRPPDYHSDKEPVPLSIIHIIEKNPPQGEEPIEWFLLTTRDIETPEQARECLEWYCLRWRIEDWHRVLKSGCKVEDLAYSTAKRLKRGIAIRAVIAWRIMLMTLQGRETPEAPADLFFSDIELQVLESFAESIKMPLPTCLNNAVRLVAKLGGYLNRKNDPPPGHQIIWQGYIALCFMTMGAELALRGS